jgi:O-acetyl-ADP-ribose deacetylase (regulator of RNase III)
VTSIAFPAISCGVFGFPAQPAAEIAVREIRKVAGLEPPLSSVILVAFDRGMLQVLRTAIGDASGSDGDGLVSLP